MKSGDLVVYSPPRVSYQYDKSLKAGELLMVINHPFGAGDIVRVLTSSGKITLTTLSYLKEIP